MSISFRDLSLGANAIVFATELASAKQQVASGSGEGATKAAAESLAQTNKSADAYIRDALNLPWEERKYDLRIQSFARDSAPQSLTAFVKDFKSANAQATKSGADMFNTLLISARSPQNSMETALQYTAQQVDFHRELLKDMYSIEGINMMVKTEQIKQEADLATSKIPSPSVTSGLVSVPGAKKKPRAKKAPASPKRGRGRPKKA